jgi:hypothetical protein
MTQRLKVNNNDTLPNLASRTQTSWPDFFSFFCMTFKKKNHILYVIESVVQKKEIKNA